MKTALNTDILSGIEIAPVGAVSLPVRGRMVRYVGPVTRVMNARVLQDIGGLLDAEPEAEIGLLVTSTGGPTGTAMNFYDTLQHVLKPKLVTIGSGDVDSSGIVIFLTGDRRYVTKRTTLLLHNAGRAFDRQRYTTREMAAMLAEDCMKDEQYATLLAERSRGMLLTRDILDMMEQQTVLSPDRLVALGLAHAVLS